MVYHFREPLPLLGIDNFHNQILCRAGHATRMPMRRALW
jgi:hypothetical protein